MPGATFTILLRDMIDQGWLDIPLRTYPIFDEPYRPLLNDKIKRHFMMREIGFETVELFDYALQTKMGEIMPLYNQLYQSQKLVFDPISTMKYHDVMHGSLDIVGHNTEDTTGDVNTTGHATADSRSRAVNSATPQTRLSGNEDYADSLADATSQTVNDTTNDAKSTGSTIGDHTNNQDSSTDRTVEGYSGFSPSKLLHDYRNQLINVDMMVITELETLFMSVYDNGDSMSDVSTGFPQYFGGIFGGTAFPYFF